MESRPGEREKERRQMKKSTCVGAGGEGKTIAILIMHVMSVNAERVGYYCHARIRIVIALNVKQSLQLQQL